MIVAVLTSPSYGIWSRPAGHQDSTTAASPGGAVLDKMKKQKPGKEGEKETEMGIYRTFD